MRKSELVDNLAKKTGISKVDIIIIVESMIKEIKTTLKSGEHIYIRGFGSFIIKHRAAKVGRNIKKNIAVNIPEKKVPSFKPSKEFVEDVHSTI